MVDIPDRTEELELLSHTHISRQLLSKCVHLARNSTIHRDFQTRYSGQLDGAEGGGTRKSQFGCIAQGEVSGTEADGGKL